MLNVTPLDWKETRRRIKADRAAFQKIFAEDAAGKRLVPLFHPSYQCVVLYRISRLCFTRGHVYLARLVWHLNLLLTGADIPPISDIGEGFCVIRPAQCVLVGKIGKNLLCHGQCGMGGGRPNAPDIGAGRGMPVIGDNVELGFGSVILGGVRVGDDVRIGPCAFVTKDIAAGMDVSVADAAPQRYYSPTVAARTFRVGVDNLL